MHDDIAWMPATDMAAAISTKQLSPVDITRRLLELIDAVNPAINAYILITRDLAMQQARAAEDAVTRGDALGPLHGVPVSIKDLFDVPGLPTTKGSLIYKDHVVDAWEYSAQRLIEYGGGVHLGKTNTPEFGYIPTTENKLFGATRNPWDTERTPGGSSGGAAAAVAAGLGPIALSSDGGGSIRIPASMCGVFGIKPTYGRVPKKPGGGWQTMTHRGPTTRTVADAALALDVMAYHEPGDPFSIKRYPGSFLDEVDRGVKGLRVAWSSDLGYAPVDPEVRAICEAAAKRFADLGCTVDEASPGFESPAATGTFMGIAGAWDAAWLGDLTDDERALIDEPAKFFLEYGKKLSGLDVVRANKNRWKIWESMRDFHKTYDLLLTPVMSCTAFPIGKPPAKIDGKDIPPMGWMSFTQPFNLNGAPAASVPCGFDSQGMPVGLHIIGRAFEDSTVLRASRAYEQIAPWADRKPPTNITRAVS
jgi:aspartyl-tRNA(Asn)/glutamyl-tRNA(Gln) amidotransferase subunit A